MKSEKTCSSEPKMLAQMNPFLLLKCFFHLFVKWLLGSTLKTRLVELSLEFNDDSINYKIVLMTLSFFFFFSWNLTSHPLFQKFFRQSTCSFVTRTHINFGLCLTKGLDQYTLVHHWSYFLSLITLTFTLIIWMSYH